MTVYLRSGRLARITLPVLAISLAACSSPTAEPPAAAEPAAVEEAAAAPTAELTPTAPRDELSGLGEPGDIPIVQVASNTEYGDFLVDGDGMSLYIFMEDSAGTSTCNGLCAENWPPLIAELGGLHASGSGIDQSLLGTSARDDGTLQATYNGQPLYHFAEDGLPGETGGQDKGDTWYLVSPAGEKIEEE